MAVTIKLALYFYAMTRLLGGEARQENAAANLGPFCVYLLLLPTVCPLLRGLDVDAAPALAQCVHLGLCTSCLDRGCCGMVMPKIPALLLMVFALQPAALRLWRPAAFQAGNRPRRLFLHSRVNIILSACCWPTRTPRRASLPLKPPAPPRPPRPRRWKTPQRPCRAPSTTVCWTPAALPVGADWEQAQEIGLLLYDRAQPAPELSVFLLDSADHDWQQDAQGLYERMQAIEDHYKVHCGLQQLFTQHAGCAVPALPQGGGYDFTLLASKGKGRTPPLYRPDGPAGCVSGRADHPPGNHLRRRHRRLHRPRRGDSLTAVRSSSTCTALTCAAWPPRQTKAALRKALEADLQTSFAVLTKATAASDLFHFGFWQQCVYGPNAAPKTPHPANFVGITMQ